MPAALPAPFYIVRGVTFRDTITLDEDLTGYGVRAEARRKPSDPEAAFSLNPVITETSAESSTIRFLITDEDTAEIESGTYYTNLLLDRPDGSVDHVPDQPEKPPIPVIVSGNHSQTLS